jgi:hypothetical protein
MGRARGSSSKLHGKFESVYGTPPSGNYIRLPFVSSNIGPEQGLIESDLLGQGREGFDPTLDVVNNDGDIVVPVDVRNFGHWLKLMTGAPVDAANDVLFDHTFTSGAAALPSMSLEVAMPEVPSFEMNYGMRGNTMRIELGRRGLLNATIGLIGKGAAAPVSTTAAGTPTSADVERFAQATGEIKKDGVRLASVVGASFAYSNNLDKVETIRPDGEIEDADPGMATASGNVTVRFGDLTLLDAATDHTPIELTFGWTLGDYSLLFTMGRVFLPKAKRPITGPNGIQASFDWQASGAEGPIMTALLTNDVTTY